MADEEEYVFNNVMEVIGSKPRTRNFQIIPILIYEVLADSSKPCRPD